MIPVTSTYADALAAFRVGALSAIVTIEGYTRQFTKNVATLTGSQVQWLVGVDDFSTSINDLDGGANLASISFDVQDRGGAITADFPAFVFEGKKVTLQIGLPSVPQSDWPVFFTGFIDSVDSNNSNLAYHFTASDTSGKLSAVVYTKGDDGQDISPEHPLTLNAHPLDIVLDILLHQVALDVSFVDSAKIEAYRDSIMAGAQFVFHLTASVAAADFIKNQILKPLGAYLWVNSAGAVTVNFFYPLAGPVAQMTLGASVWETIPEAEQTDVVNTVVMQFDKDDATADASGKYMAQATNEYGPSLTLYNGQVGEQSIQADGLRSAYQGFYTAALVSRMIFMRYGFKNLKFDSNAADGNWQLCRLEPGDIVAVTHSKVPDRKLGVMGVTNKLFEVLDRTIEFNTGKVKVTLIDASYLSSFGNYKIAPDAIADFTLASSSEQSRYMFLCGDDDKYSDGTAAHVLG